MSTVAALLRDLATLRVLKRWTAKSLFGERTYDELRELLRRALETEIDGGEGRWVWLRDFSATRIVFELNGGWPNPGCYAAPYVIDPQTDEVTFGAPTPVDAEMEYTPRSLEAPAAKALVGPGMSTSAMVAFYPAPAVARRLALPGGYKPDDLHITLAYLGPDAVLQLDRQAVEAALAPFAASWSQALEGSVSGIGRFTPEVPPGRGADGDGEWPLVALVDVPALPEFRQRLVATLEASGVEVSHSHGFCPHATLAMIGAGDEYAAAQILGAGIESTPVRFGEIVLAWGDDRIVFPLGPDAYDILDGEDDDLVAYTAKGALGPVVKADPSLRYTFAPFYPASPESPTPDDLDAHGEFATAEDLRKGLWAFVRKGDRAVRLQHVDGTQIGEVMDAVQWPWETTMDLSLPDGTAVTKTFAPGTVFTGVVWTELGWDLVEKGLVTGYSLGGTARRLEVEVAA